MKGNLLLLTTPYTQFIVIHIVNFEVPYIARQTKRDFRQLLIHLWLVQDENLKKMINLYLPNLYGIRQHWLKNMYSQWILTIWLNHFANSLSRYFERADSKIYEYFVQANTSNLWHLKLLQDNLTIHSCERCSTLIVKSFCKRGMHSSNTFLTSSSVSWSDCLISSSSSNTTTSGELGTSSGSSTSLYWSKVRSAQVVYLMWPWNLEPPTWDP